MGRGCPLRTGAAVGCGVSAIKTYPEMDKQIVAMLRISDRAIDLYAAQRIEELERNLGKALNAMGRAIACFEAPAPIRFHALPVSPPTESGQHIAIRYAHRRFDGFTTVNGEHVGFHWHSLDGCPEDGACHALNATGWVLLDFDMESGR